MGCIAGYQTLFIDASGEICPCDFTPLSFGNIKETPITEIWTQMKEYFPRPRTDCLMRDIAEKIDSSILPLSPNESKKIIPQIDEKSPASKIYTILTRR
jgi:MoaA/NifB/PqqE/SkfB family radical SAM enzyme